MHSNPTIRSNTSLRSLFSKMCVFVEGGLKLLSPTVVCFCCRGDSVVWNRKSTEIRTIAFHLWTIRLFRITNLNLLLCNKILVTMQLLSTAKILLTDGVIVND